MAQQSVAADGRERVALPELPELIPLPDLGGIRFTVEHTREMNDPQQPHEGDHTHGCYEIYAHQAGDMRFLVGDRLFTMHKDDLLLIEPYTFHHGVFSGRMIFDYSCLWFSADPPVPPLPALPACRLYRDCRRGAALIDRLRDEQDPLLRTALFLELLQLLSRTAGEQPADEEGLPPEFVQILTALSDACTRGESVRVGELAARHFVSTRTLGRWFARYLHMTPKQFLEAKRLSTAQALLLRGTSVGEAAERCGYADRSHFIAAFRRAFGKTPLAYVRENRGR